MRDLVVIFLESIGLDVSSIQSEEELERSQRRTIVSLFRTSCFPAFTRGQICTYGPPNTARGAMPFISGYKQGVLTDEDMAHQTPLSTQTFSKSAFLSKVDECLSLPAEQFVFSENENYSP